MGFRFFGAHITNNYFIDDLFSVERHCRFGDEVNGVGAVDSVPNALVQPSKLFCQKLGPVCFIGAHNDMAKFLKSTGGRVNESIGFETVAKSGCIAVSSAD